LNNIYFFYYTGNHSSVKGNVSLIIPFLHQNFWPRRESVETYSVERLGLWSLKGFPDAGQLALRSTIANVILKTYWALENIEKPIRNLEISRRRDRNREGGRRVSQI
jgi:hypothetical protein